MTDNRGYMQKYAMLFGTYMGIFWIIKFTLLPLGLIVPFLSFLFIGLTICVPFMGYRYARSFRNQVCGGELGFFQSWLFTVCMYLYAALLTAMAHYVYFRFIDQGFIIDTCEAELSTIAGQGTAEENAYVDSLMKNLQNIRYITPIELTMELMSLNAFYGMLLALPTALFVMKKPLKQ